MEALVLDIVQAQAVEAVVRLLLAQERRERSIPAATAIAPLSLEA